MTVVSYFIEALSQYSFTPDNEAMMKALSDLYALHGIVENAAEFMNVRSVCMRAHVCICLCVHVFMRVCSYCGMTYTTYCSYTYTCAMYVSTLLL